MRQWGALVGLLLAVLVPDAMALVVERPCCASMTHVSGEFTDVMALAETPVAATELVPVTPFHACEPLAQGVDLTDRIALVQRGECNFVKKVYHAQLAGAVGVVVMDSAARAEPPYHIIMQKDENASLVSIPAVFVKYEDGEGLLRRVQTAPPWRPVLVTLSDVGELVPQDKSSYRVVKRVIAYIFLVSAVCALSSGLSIVSSFVFNAIGRTWRTRVTKKLPLMSYRPLLQQELLEHAVRDLNVIDRIVFDDPDDPPASVIDSVHSESLDPSLPRPADAEACSICLDDFDTGDRVKVLPCQHFFHVGCIDPWLERRSGRCPLCKMDAIAATDEAPKSIFGLSLPRLEQILRQEHWFHTFFLMLPASLVSCLIVNTAASIMRNMWP